MPRMARAQRLPELRQIAQDVVWIWINAVGTEDNALPVDHKRRQVVVLKALRLFSYVNPVLFQYSFYRT